MLQVGEQFWQAGEGLRRSLLQTVLLGDGLHVMLRQPGQQAFPDARGMQKHPPPHPRVHLEKSGRLYLLDINRFALVQDRQVHGQVNSLHQRPHKRQRHICDVQVGLGISTETQYFQAQPIPPGFRFTPQVAAFF